MSWQQLSQALCEQVEQAAASNTALRIQGGNSKAFYGRSSNAAQEMLSLSDYRGIINYEPTELVITAAAGTPLSELEQILSEQNQMLPFEPPHFGAEATLGGTIACGFSGPRRPYAGSARDYVLGCSMINGKGELLKFGGEVMKNVAGYDVSRLLTGSLGTLGPILDISLKILPQPAEELTLRQSCDEQEAISRCNQWAGKPLPLSATAYYNGHLYIRLAGAASAVQAAKSTIGGEELSDSIQFWQDLREQQLDFFQPDVTQTDAALWRLSIPAATAPLQLPGQTLIEWGGAQRWLYTKLDPAAVFAAASSVGGHAVLFRDGSRHTQVFQPLSPVALKLHQRLKQSFDSKAIFNPGRMYAEF